MCVAGINATTQPCQHRWAHLLKPCDPSRDLQTCPDKLKFSGWEQRHDGCPWCSPDTIFPHDSTHRLFGGSSCPISPSTTTETTELRTPQRQRSGSESTFSTLSRHSSVNTIEEEWAEKGQRHRDRNDRLAIYLTSLPHEVLPSARKYYPTYSDSSSEDGSELESRPICRRTSSGLSKKAWGKRLSRAMFKG